MSSPITLSVDSASIELEKKNVGSIDVDADFADLRGTLSAHTPKIPLLGLDEANGVDVELMIGDYVAVENIAMTLRKGKL